jgi:hypothetical protein
VLARLGEAGLCGASPKGKREAGRQPWISVSCCGREAGVAARSGASVALQQGDRWQLVQAFRAKFGPQRRGVHLYLKENVHLNAPRIGRDGNKTITFTVGVTR